MKGKKCFIKFTLILISLFVGCVINTKPTNAERVRNLTPTSIEYSTTPTGTKTTLNIGTLLNTPVQTLQITGNQRLFIRRINFNREMNLNAETKRTLIIPLVIRTFTPNSNFQNTETRLAYSQFDCPTAEYGTAAYGFRVEKCDIKSANIINLPATGNFDTANGNEWSQNLIMSEYIVDIYIKAVLGNATNTYIDFVDTPMFSFLKNSGTNIIVGWQVGFIGMPYIVEPDIDPVEEELKEQNEKDEQDRSNLQTQQEETDETAEDQEEAAKTTGQTLFSAFSSLVSALGNVHQTNCKLPNMSVYTITLNNMDLCSVNLPNGVSALAGIAMCFIIVKMGISLVHRMLNLYKEIIG